MQKLIKTIESKSQGKAVKLNRSRRNAEDKPKHSRDIDRYSIQKQAGDQG